MAVVQQVRAGAGARVVRHHDRVPGGRQHLRRRTRSRPVRRAATPPPGRNRRHASGWALTLGMRSRSNQRAAVRLQPGSRYGPARRAGVRSSLRHSVGVEEHASPTRPRPGRATRVDPAISRPRRRSMPIRVWHSAKNCSAAKHRVGDAELAAGRLPPQPIRHEARRPATARRRRRRAPVRGTWRPRPPSAGRWSSPDSDIIICSMRSPIARSAGRRVAVRVGGIEHMGELGLALAGHPGGEQLAPCLRNSCRACPSTRRRRPRCGDMLAPS